MPIIPASWEVEIRSMIVQRPVQAKKKKKVSDTPSKSIPGYGGICLTSQLLRNRKIMVQA
jgi:hypothetical protein